MSTKLNFTLTIPDCLQFNLTANSQPSFDKPHSAYNRCPSQLFFSSMHDENYQGKLAIINETLDDCTVQVNFFGAREIVTKEGADMAIVPIALDRVAHRTLSHHHGEDDRITKEDEDSLAEENELESRDAIYRKLKGFYNLSDEQIANANPITKLFNYIRENFHPFDGIVNLIGSVSGWGIRAQTVRQRIESSTNELSLNIQ